MKYSIGDKVKKQGSSDEYVIVATEDDHNGYELEPGFDYLIQKEDDKAHTERAFAEDIDR